MGTTTKVNNQDSSIDPHGGGKGADGRPYLIVNPGNLDAVADEAMRILTDEGIDIFQRGGKLVRPITQEGVDSKGQAVHFPVLTEVSFAFLRKMLSRYVDWYKRDARGKGGPLGKGFRRIEAPKEIAETIRANAGFLDLQDRGWHYQHTDATL